jgi:hypothetical protein
MKKINILLLSMLVSGAALFTGCSKDDDNTDTTPAVLPKLTIEMDHLAGLQKFYFDSAYTTADGDIFTADLFKYYVSNVRLVRTDNSEYAIPETYFLVNHADMTTMQLQMDSLATGSFKGIKFILGVDSARNVSGAQTGALDPVNGMFWTWNTGYIFFKLEGASAVIPTPAQTFTYHIGGFSGANVNYKEISLDFDGDILPLANNTNPELHIVVDVLELFKNPSTIDLETFSSSVVMPNPSATTLANNYVDMFKYDHIHND